VLGAASDIANTPSARIFRTMVISRVEQTLCIRNLNHLFSGPSYIATA
jgi:hypothetical protein